MTRRQTGFPPKVRDMIADRAGGRCEVCPTHEWSQQHHRRARGAGGTRRESTSSASNGISVCLLCHARIESHRTLALELGLLVLQSQEPADVPVRLRYGWVYLDDAGGWARVPGVER